MYFIRKYCFFFLLFYKKKQIVNNILLISIQKSEHNYALSEIMKRFSNKNPKIVLFALNIINISL